MCGSSSPQPQQAPPPAKPTTFDSNAAHNETRGRALENQRIIASASSAENVGTFGSELGGPK